MSRKITTLISFKIESRFEEWLKIFDSIEADLRYFFYIKRYVKHSQLFNPSNFEKKKITLR